MSTLHASQDLINLIKQINLDINYPVGSIYLSFDKNSPGSRLGGTWQLCGSGRYLMCYDPNNAWFDKPGSDHGSENGPGNWRDEGTTITIDQMPYHNHEETIQTTDGNYNAVVRNRTGGSTSLARWPEGAYGGWTNTGSGDTMKTYAVGGGKPHSHFHVSPYMTVCVWERTA